MITTEAKLRAALQRILEGKPRLIDTNRKLSVRAVEDEADVGKDTAYYYEDFIDEIKEKKSQSTNVVDLNVNILKSDEYLELKSKYEKEKKKRKTAESINKKHASTLNKYQSTLNSNLLENQELHQRLSELSDDLAKLRRKGITKINSQVK